MSGFVRAARLSELPAGAMRGVEVNSGSLLLANVDGTVYALHDECSHEEFPLSDGELEGCEVTCLLHGARFDLATGAARSLPAVKPVRTYECRVEGDEVLVNLD